MADWRKLLYGSNYLRLCTCLSKRSVRRKTAHRTPGISRGGSQYLSGQSKRKGFQPPSLPAAHTPPAPPRSPGDQIYRPPGAQLRGNPGTVAVYYQEKAGRHRHFGYASFGYQADGENLTGTFVADLVLQILSYVAQTERENIRQRQKEGIAAARQRGVQFGRPRKPVPEAFCHLKTTWEAGSISSREAARQLSISQDTFLRWVRGK